ncbi:MAG: alkaline phosphatase family protein, partial [Planctomycetota bacterium]
MKSRWAIIWLLPLVWVQTVGCRMDVPPEIRLSPRTVIPPRPEFGALRAAGKLPNITRYLVDRGVTVCGAVASLPTITFANNVSFHTGLLPGHHGIVGNKWFDRHRLIFQDYGFIRTYQQVDDDFRATTIYEALADEHTATILSPVRRGATRNIDNWMSAGIAWYFGMQKTINRLTTMRFALIADVANRAGRWPAVILAYFVTPDTVGHACGPDSTDCLEMLLDID